MPCCQGRGRVALRSPTARPSQRLLGGAVATAASLAPSACRDGGQPHAAAYRDPPARFVARPERVMQASAVCVTYNPVLLRLRHPLVTACVCATARRDRWEQSFGASI
jgi:hypothetical protein